MLLQFCLHNIIPVVNSHHQGYRMETLTIETNDRLDFQIQRHDKWTMRTKRRMQRNSQKELLL
jgi:hypothetical protein